MNKTSGLQEFWDTVYQDSATPFDVERPDEWVAALANDGKIQGNVLDAGCGPGRTSRYLAKLGHSVLGVDFSLNAIQRAERRAAGTEGYVQFAQAHICKLFGFDRHFDTVVDIGCFHSLDASERGSYAAALHRYCKPHSVVYLRAFSASNEDKTPHPSGRPTPALREEQITDAFAGNGWVVHDLREKEIELFISANDVPKAKCWFAEMHYA
jgi:SAM-dependent methyltransferase